MQEKKDFWGLNSGPRTAHVGPQGPMGDEPLKRYPRVQEGKEIWVREPPKPRGTGDRQGGVDARTGPALQPDSSLGRRGSRCEMWSSGQRVGECEEEKRLKKRL